MGYENQSFNATTSEVQTMSSLSVGTNTSALHGLNSLRKVQQKQDSLYNQLSSGKRINSAKDDAAGLQISDRLLAQLNGINQGNRNANDGIAFYQTAEGALQGTTDALLRMRDLAVQAANGTLSSEDRQALQGEVNQLSAEVTRTAENTTFNGETFLNGTASGNNGSTTLHVGANSQDTVGSSMQGGFTMQQMLNETSSGAYGNSSAAAAAAQNAQTLVDGNGSSYASLDISTQANAENAIAAIDSMISYVDSARAENGAMMNRLESTINVQSNVAINTADARARINDTDYAEAASQLATQNILEQATIAMQTHANARPKMALALLGS